MKYCMHIYISLYLYFIKLINASDLDYYKELLIDTANKANINNVDLSDKNNMQLDICENSFNYTSNIEFNYYNEPTNIQINATFSLYDIYKENMKLNENIISQHTATTATSDTNYLNLIFYNTSSYLEDVNCSNDDNEPFSNLTSIVNLAITGQKSVIIFIDINSASTSANSRLKLQIQNAKEVIQNLTYYDYFTIITYAKDSTIYSNVLIQATNSNKNKAVNYLDDLSLSNSIYSDLNYALSQGYSLVKNNVIQNNIKSCNNIFYVIADYKNDYYTTDIYTIIESSKGTNYESQIIISYYNLNNLDYISFDFLLISCKTGGIFGEQLTNTDLINYFKENIEYFYPMYQQRQSQIITSLSLYNKSYDIIYLMDVEEIETEIYNSQTCMKLSVIDTKCDTPSKEHSGLSWLLPVSIIWSIILLIINIIIPIIIMNFFIEPRSINFKIIEALIVVFIVYLTLSFFTLIIGDAASIYGHSSNDDDDNDNRCGKVFNKFKSFLTQEEINIVYQNPYTNYLYTEADIGVDIHNYVYVPYEYTYQNQQKIYYDKYDCYNSIDCIDNYNIEYYDGIETTKWFRNLMVQ